ncbi:uncharacterized protein KY384_006936 [Bacidia gigantensis]|uniref:uncharacterized protein n=1 Tax=Bacidia gigantensis TaxID=2732470 RepID=UPI001D03D497|nr:uncharacterized protein KY384_006936 [Bacidia gigantensis]KAG8528020.1 hypothetical protein KY384_006936 [Bacidia gigantensis]
MRVFSTSYTFDYGWDEVSIANWRKYCLWNKSSSHVVGVDTLSRQVDPSTGILVTERLITCTQPAPAVVRALLGGQCTTHSYEKSYVDPKRKIVTMCSSNMTWTNLVSVREIVVYEPDKQTSFSSLDRTKFSQEARITALCGGWQKVKAKIEEATLERFRENAKKGREGLEAVLEMSRRAFGEERERRMQIRKEAEA